MLCIFIFEGLNSNEPLKIKTLYSGLSYLKVYVGEKLLLSFNDDGPTCRVGQSSLDFTRGSFCSDVWNFISLVYRLIAFVGLSII